MALIGNPIVSTDFPVDYASGNGSTTAFTLSVAPASVNSIDVQISGVSQSPQTYSVSGTTLTFSAAPPTGTNNIVVRHLGVAGIPNTPSAASVAYSSLNSSLQGTVVGRNKIINGAMVFDQRNAGASVTPDGSYTLDRWRSFNSQTSKFSVQQNSATNPAGFPLALVVTSSSAYSISTTDYFGMAQPIEGYNIADLAWGSASAKTVTLSFWVRSSLTGTFGGVLRNSGSTRTYAFSYTINAANTWEQKSITIAGETTGTWLTTNGIGIYLSFSLGTGSTYTTTAGSWVNGNYLGATGETSVVGTSGATWYITGVQLEVGTTATNFEVRSYGTELALCQRYYQTIGYYLYGAGASGGGNSWVGWQFKVTMRANPTIANPNSSGGALNQAYPDGATWYYGGGYATFGASSTATAEL